MSQPSGKIAVLRITALPGTSYIAAAVVDSSGTAFARTYSGSGWSAWSMISPNAVDVSIASPAAGTVYVGVVLRDGTTSIYSVATDGTGTVNGTALN